MKALLLEDDEKIRDFACRALIASGGEVETAASAEEATRPALHGGHDVFIVDLTLPGMADLEFTERCRTRSVATPVIILSERPSVDERAAPGGDAGRPSPQAHGQ